MSLWNIKNLESPPITTYKTSSRDVDINKLRKIFKGALNGFNREGLNLSREAAHISRWIYRMKTKFRSDKGLKCVEKINRALLQLLRINFNETLKTFMELVPIRYTEDNYLPTLNNLHFVLVRIQGVAKLMIRIIELSRSAAEFFQDRIERGHFWNISLICLASIARIYKISKGYTKILCKSYDELLPFTNVLQNNKFNWLPVDYDFPSNLKEWLNADELLEDVKVFKPKIAIPPIFNLTNAEIDIEFNEGDASISQPNSTSKKARQDHSTVTKNNNIKNLTTMNSSNIESTSDEDIGEAIVTRPADNIPKQTKSLNSIKLINKIRSFKDLIKFQNDLKQNNLRGFENVGPLKNRILLNKLKKLIKKGGKNSEDLNQFLGEAREVIKSLLL